MAHEEGHERLRELHEAWLRARRDWRVALRVHLEAEHGVEVSRRDPEKLHRELHGG